MNRGLTPEPQRSELLAAAAAVNGTDQELREAVRSAHMAGGSVREIAALIDRSTNTIQRWLREGQRVGKDRC